jgi:preprotein translocase subunit SecD
MALKHFHRLLTGIGILAIGVLSAKSSGSIFEIRSVANGPAPAAEQMSYVSPDHQTVPITVVKRPLLDLGAVQSAAVATDSAGKPELQITFTPAGRLRFAELTKQRIHQRIAVVIDGKIRAVPTIQAELNGAYIPVQGLTESEASDLAAKLNAAIGSK